RRRDVLRQVRRDQRVRAGAGGGVGGRLGAADRAADRQGGGRVRPAPTVRGFGGRPRGDHRDPAGAPAGGGQLAAPGGGVRRHRRGRGRGGRDQRRRLHPQSVGARRPDPPGGDRGVPADGAAYRRCRAAAGGGGHRPAGRRRPGGDRGTVPQGG